MNAKYYTFFPLTLQNIPTFRAQKMNLKKIIFFTFLWLYLIFTAFLQVFRDNGCV